MCSTLIEDLGALLSADLCSLVLRKGHPRLGNPISRLSKKNYYCSIAQRAIYRKSSAMVDMTDQSSVTDLEQGAKSCAFSIVQVTRLPLKFVFLITMP
jgi:hypothetical protein